jgi:hypothetical protein
MNDFAALQSARNQGTVSCQSRRQKIRRLTQRSLLSPIGKTQLISLENAKRCQSIFNGLPFCLMVKALRYRLKPIENRGLCGCNPLWELLAVKFDKGGLVLVLPMWEKNFGRWGIFGCHNAASCTIVFRQPHKKPSLVRGAVVGEVKTVRFYHEP